MKFYIDMVGCCVYVLKSYVGVFKFVKFIDGYEIIVFSNEIMNFVEDL